MKLVDSPFKKGLFSRKNTACKKDFERYLGFYENNKDFNKWIDNLIEEGCLICAGKEPKGIGKMTDVFIVDNKTTFLRLKRLQVYIELLDFFGKRAFLGAIDES